MEKMKCHSPSQDPTAKHESYAQLTATSATAPLGPPTFKEHPLNMGASTGPTPESKAAILGGWVGLFSSEFKRQLVVCAPPTPTTPPPWKRKRGGHEKYDRTTTSHPKTGGTLVFRLEAQEPFLYHKSDFVLTAKSSRSL